MATTTGENKALPSRMHSERLQDVNIELVDKLEALTSLIASWIAASPFDCPAHATLSNHPRSTQA